MDVSKRPRNSSHELGVKRAEKHVRVPKTTIKSLPNDLFLTQVLARVSSSSFTDLYNIKLSCKDFLKAGEDEYLSRCVSIDKFPVVQWSPPCDRMSSFLTDCFNKGNPEALFRQGMIEYFSEVKVESGLEYLKRASEKGHMAATYVYSMILLSKGDRYTQQALILLNATKSSRRGDWNVVDCRNKSKSVLREMWIKNSISLKEVNFKCQERDHAIRVRRVVIDEDKELSRCDTCMWYEELLAFCKIVNGVA